MCPTLYVFIKSKKNIKTNQQKIMILMAFKSRCILHRHVCVMKILFPLPIELHIKLFLICPAVLEKMFENNGHIHALKPQGGVRQWDAPYKIWF